MERAKGPAFTVDEEVKSALPIDEQKIDETVLGLLYLTLHDGCRAWKSFDWQAMTRLHEKGLIEDPVNKAKSVVLTGKALSKRSGCSRSCSSRNSDFQRGVREYCGWLISAQRQYGNLIFRNVYYHIGVMGTISAHLRAERHSCGSASLFPWPCSSSARPGQL